MRSLMSGLVVPLAVVLMAPLAAAQARPSVAGAAAPTPVLIVSGQGEVRVLPDRAAIEVVVETRGRDAAAAGVANARVVQIVRDTLSRLGFAGAAVSTSGYGVMPEQRYDRDGRSATITGYRAGNGVQVRVDDIARIGSVIDAALAAGATRVGRVRFTASTEGARQLEALIAAVTQARQRAEAMALAAGGTLGALEQLTSERLDPGLGFQAARMRASGGGDLVVSFSESAPTQITPGEMTVVVTVLGQWRFIPASPAGSAR